MVSFFSLSVSSSNTKATMAKTRMPIIKPVAYTSNIAIEAPAPYKWCRGREVQRCGYEGAGSYAPARIQAQHGLCPIAERTFENSGQSERVKSRYTPR